MSISCGISLLKMRLGKKLHVKLQMMFEYNLLENVKRMGSGMSLLNMKLCQNWRDKVHVHAETCMVPKR